jgi:hypothetical protein
MKTEASRIKPGALTMRFQKKITATKIPLLTGIILLFIFPASALHASESSTLPRAIAGAEQSKVPEKKENPVTELKMPKAYKAGYLLHWNKYKIKVKATRQLQINDKGEATLKQNASTFAAKIDQQSNFKLSSSTCAFTANNYHYQRTVLGKKKLYRIEFNNNDKQFIEVNDNEKNQHEFKTTLYDELSYQEALRCELINASELKPDTAFDYLVRTKGKNKAYQFKVAGFETITTKLGDLETVKVERLRSGTKGEELRETFIWFSKKHDHLIVKLQQIDGDDSYGLEIEYLE